MAAQQRKGSAVGLIRLVALVAAAAAATTILLSSHHSVKAEQDGVEDEGSDHDDIPVVQLNYLHNNKFEQQCEHEDGDGSDDEDFSHHDRHKPVLVLLHGVDDSSHTWHDLLLDEDANDSSDDNEDGASKSVIDWPTIALDLRGYGISPLGPHEDHEDNIDDFGPEAMVEDISSTLDAIFSACANKRHNSYETEIIMLGHSMGGRVAMMYAAKYPDHVRGLIIEDSDTQHRDRDEFSLTLDDEGVKGFPKSFQTIDEATKALIDVGYGEEMVLENYIDEERIREIDVDSIHDSHPLLASSTDGSDTIVWSDVNPERRVLGYETILSTDKGKHAWQQIADQVEDGHSFPCFLFLAEYSITDDESIEEMEDVFNEHEDNQHRLDVREFEDSSHNIHNTDRHNFLVSLHEVLHDIVDHDQDQDQDGDGDDEEGDATVTAEL